MYYTSYKANSASFSIVLGSFSAVVSTTLGILLLGEALSWQKILGVVLVLAGIAYVNYRKGEKLSLYNLYALAGGFFFGIAFTIDKSIVTTALHPTMYVSLICFGVALVSFLASGKRIIQESKTLQVIDFRPMFFSALFGTLFNVFTQFSYINGGDVGKVDAINNSTVFGVILIELVVFKERESLRKKLLAASLAVIGIILFTL